MYLGIHTLYIHKHIYICSKTIKEEKVMILKELGVTCTPLLHCITQRQCLTHPLTQENRKWFLLTSKVDMKLSIKRWFIVELSDGVKVSQQAREVVLCWVFCFAFCIF